VLTFAIRPALFVDDGPDALARLTAQINDEKKARTPAGYSGAATDDDDG
jgi:hypothetical protein